MGFLLLLLGQADEDRVRSADETVVNELLVMVVDDGLIYSQCKSYFERCYLRFKLTVACSEGDPGLIALFDSDEDLGIPDVHFSNELDFTNSIKQF